MIKLLNRFKRFKSWAYIRPLNRLNNKIIMAPTSNNKFYEKNVRWQLSSAIEYLIHDDKSWKKNIRKLWDNKYVVLILILVTYSFILSYNMGSLSREGEIMSLNASIEAKGDMIGSQKDIIYYNKSVVQNKNEVIDSLANFKKSREWLEFKIYKETEMDDFYLNMSRVSDDILLLMAEQVDKYKIPYSIYFRLIDVESGYKFISNHEGSGAFGYMQVMPGTFNSYSNILGLEGGHTKKNNIYVGSYMLYKSHNDWMDRGFDEHVAWEYTLSEYNAGESKLQVFDADSTVIGWRIPNYTKRYIREIMKTYNEKYRY